MNPTMEMLLNGERKGAGLGRKGIEFAIHEMTEPKVVCYTRPSS
jgi:glyceraldehyde-3-phosphate dehydrogenase (NADP+)